MTNRAFNINFAKRRSWNRAPTTLQPADNGRDAFGAVQAGGTRVKSAQGRLALNVVQTCVTGTMFCALLGCAMMDATKSDLSATQSPGVGDQVRGLDLSPRFPTTVEETSSSTRNP